jgi:hypothetical protein
VLLDDTGIVTLAVGAELRETLNVVDSPYPVVIKPLVGVTVTPPVKR